MSNYLRIKLDSTPPLIGQASLYKRGNRLIIRFPDCVGLGRNKYWSTGLPDSVDGLCVAKQLLNMINSDIVFGQFDPQLEKYKPLYKREKYLEEVERLIGSDTPLYDLWVMYCDYKAETAKESYMDKLRVTIGSVIKKIDIKNIHDSQAVIRALKSVTTNYMADLVLVKLSTLYEWCLTKKIIKGENNPYPGVLREFRLNNKFNKVMTPRPLTSKELDHLFTTINIRYHNLIKFCLMVGCRPSEAVGIEWQDVNLEEGYIYLGRSIRIKNGKIYKEITSKNGKVRPFPLNDALKAHIESLPKICDLVNPNPDQPGKPFVYDSYANAWRRVMPKDTTPYCCRDTFISNQIEKGIPPAIVAKWCDNSISVIEKHYLKISNNVKPL